MTINTEQTQTLRYYYYYCVWICKYVCFSNHTSMHVFGLTSMNCIHTLPTLTGCDLSEEMLLEDFLTQCGNSPVHNHMVRTLINQWQTKADSVKERFYHAMWKMTEMSVTGHSKLLLSLSRFVWMLMKQDKNCAVSDVKNGPVMENTEDSTRRDNPDQ